MVANMASVVGPKMAVAASDAGGMAIWPRSGTWSSEYDKFLTSMNQSEHPVHGITFGLKDDEWTEIHEYHGSAQMICLDVARGDSQIAVERARSLRETFPDEILMVGNVCLPATAHALVGAGVDIIKIGIGPGAACTTRLVAGVGVPQLEAVQRIHRELLLEGVRDVVRLVADGGIKHPGDVAKAIVAGADAVMSGYMFSRCEEAAEAVYRGSSTYTDERTHEGVAFQVPKITTVAKVMSDIEGGLRSAMSYCNSTTLKQLQERGRLIRITRASQVESRSL